MRDQSRSLLLETSLYGRKTWIRHDRSEKVREKVPLRKNTFDHFAVNIGQPVIPALESIGQSRVVESKLMQDSGLQVMNMYFVFDNAEAEFIGLTIGHTATDPTTR